MAVDTGNFFENQREIELRLMKALRTDNAWSVEDPDSGVVRTFDPDNTTTQEIADVLATLLGDIYGR